MHITDKSGKCSHCTTKEDPTIAQVVKKTPVANHPDVEALLKQFRKGDRSMKIESVEALRTGTIGKSVTLSAGGIDWKGILDSRVDQSGMLHAGITLDDDLGRFQVSLREDKQILATVLFTGESQALYVKGFPENGAWTLEATDLDHVMCKPPGAVYTPPGKTAQANAKAPQTTSANRVVAADAAPIIPVLSSNPKSPYVLYCDFDGEIITSPHWNEGKTINAIPIDGANDPTFVTRVWQRASEDFAAFDINVTTDRKMYDAAPVSNRVMCVVTVVDDAAPGAGGVAMLGSFGQDIPCWAFNPTEGSCSDTISHETGHTLSLIHDGTTAKVEYYGGNSLPGALGWAPIMGAYFSDNTDEEITSWGKGEYPNANNKEDDLQIITSGNGFSYKKDDHSDTRLGAAPFIISNGAILDSGVIERNTDVDWFSFTTNGGPFRLNVTVPRVVGSLDILTRGSNMAVSAELYNATGKLVQSSNRPDSLDASLSATLQPGIYYVKIDGVGRGTVAAGWSDYSSLGNYKVSGRFPLTTNLVISPAYLKYGQKGGEGMFNISAGDKWTWSTNVAWVESVEVTTQNGNQEFTYTVNENPSYAPRAAEIIITTGAESASHAIIQAAKVPDDHGDDMKGATTVELNSTTDGRINFLDDVDMFEIHVTEAGFLTVGTSGLTNTFGRLFDDQELELAFNDDAVKTNCRIVYPVVPGIYYATVSLPPGATYDPKSADYKFESSFVSTDKIIIDPLSRTTKPTVGEFEFDVLSNTDWTWTIWQFDGVVWVEDNSWLMSDESVNQSLSQTFTYTVAENPTAAPRRGQIRFQKVGSLVVDVIHEVVQTGLGSDDHGDTILTATPAPVNGSIQGVIEAEGDVDVFQIDLPAIGELTVGTTGTLDSFGYLLDSNGDEIVSNDDVTDFNFGITRAVAPGRYFVKVRHFQSTQTGAYQLFVGFKSPSFVTLAYKVDRSMGSIAGAVTQKLKPGGNGRRVTARPMSGYVFTGWSDGLPTASRTDLKVLSDLTVTAMFARILSVQIQGGDFLVDNQKFPSVVFGDVSANQPVTINFVIKNIGTKALSKINITRFGPNSKDWIVAPLPKTTLNPGESMVMTATLQSSQIGIKFAVLTVNAIGNPLPFRINVEGTVTGSTEGAPLEPEAR